MYYFSLDYIVSYLKENVGASSKAGMYYVYYLLFYNGKTYKFKNFKEKYIMIVESNNGVEELDLEYLYKNNLIDYDDNIFLKKEINDINNYDQLYAAMDKGDKTGMYSRSFYHYTTLDNMINIVKEGAIKSRKESSFIPDDNYQKNNTTKFVMDINKSKYLPYYVRFYFRPQNDFSYNYCKHYCNKELVLIEVNRNVLSLSDYPTYLFPYSSQYAQDDDYLIDYSLNYRKEFNLKNKEKFNFRAIYSSYDALLDWNIKKMQRAELNVAVQVDLNFIEHIYFSSENGKNIFLNKIKDFSNSEFVKSKVKVKSELFWR